MACRAGSSRTGRPWLVLEVGGLEATQWNGPVLSLDRGAVRLLGPDLLAETTDPAALVPRLRRTEASRLLGEVLQDHRLVAGVGNRCRRCGDVILARGQGDDNRTAYWCAGCRRGPVTDA